MPGRQVDMKVVLLGHTFGGKTCLSQRYLSGNYNENLPYQTTVGAAFAAKPLDVGGRTLTLGVWDTAGSERYESMSRIYYRGAKAAVICYDLTDKRSFDRAKFWIREVQDVEENCQIYMCGTKRDLITIDKKERGVDYQTTIDFAHEVGSEVFETSSKTGENIKELFTKIAEDYVRNLDTRKSKYEHSGFILQDSHKKSKKKCGCN